MKIEDIRENLQKFDGLKNEQKEAITKLIDLKIESDMDKVLDKMDAKFAGMEAKIAGIEASTTAKFDGLRSEIIGINHKIEGQVGGLSHKIDGQQKSIYIIIAGLVFAIISFFLNK